MFLGGQESLEDYLGLVVPRPILRAVVASSFYQYFVRAAPALRELTMMGKVYHEIERRSKRKPRWDLIVFDTPASGQALSMLKMPFVARESFGDSIVAREADAVASFFADRRRCAAVAVTSAEPLAIAETLEIYRTLEALAIATAAVVFNGLAPAAFESADIARMVRRGMREPALKHVDQLAEIARGQLRRRNRERRALGILLRQINTPVIELEERSGLSASALNAALASQMADDAEAVPPQSADARRANV
jgi:anion-transporting  ArsA/GET3 family ATPase